MLDKDLMRLAARHATKFLDGLPNRPAGATGSRTDLHAALGGALPQAGTDPAAVIDMLANAVEPGLVASAGPRYFGFVCGGSLPTALAADWLTSAWDQNAGLYAGSPAASVVEEIVAQWLLDLLQLPATASFGFVTGCQMANFVGLASARHHVLEQTGWNVEESGLFGAPPINVLVGNDAHVTIFTTLNMLGVGSGRVLRVPADDQGRMKISELVKTLDTCKGPTIICAQAGNVNSGAFDPLEQIAALARRHQAWLHIDGAFGLWAAASPALRHLVAGMEGADSWAFDAHKWLNVPYDSGVAIVAHPESHRATKAVRAAYLMRSGGPERDPFEWTPEASRRARGFAIYAALRSLGQRGVTELVDRCCRLAVRMADRLKCEPGVEIINDVVLNQVLVRLHPSGGKDPDQYTWAVIARVQKEGTCWLGGTVWHGVTAMRISVSNWATSEDDADRSVDAIVKAMREELAAS